MKFSPAKLRPLGLCIGIVITGVMAWWLAGPEREVPSRLPLVSRPAVQAKAVRALPLVPAKPGEGQPRWDEVAQQPPVQIEMNRFQERLLKEATLLDRRQFDPRGSEPAREVKLWRTDFKYPLVREEVWLRADAQGRKLPVRREFSVADHVMVQFPASTTAERIAAWMKQHHLQVRQALKTAPVYLIAATDGNLNTAEAIMGAFKKDFPDAPAQMGTAERDYLVFPSLIPTDTSFSQLWGMHNTGQTGGTVDADIDAPEAWDITTGSRNVVVGVIDTGVDRTHPDLAANMWTNPLEIAGNGVDDDQNGFVDDVNGWDFFSNDNNPMDTEGHGTHCAGTIGGVGNNVTGVTGVCWQVSIVGLRFLGPNGGSTSDAIEAVNYSNDLGVDLTSNSWGGGGFSALLQTAIANAGAAGQLFIAAAGNDGSNTDSILNYPSGYAVDTIVAVASSTSTDTRSSFSNYGATTVDLAAPGSSIYSTIPGSSYATYSGTSMATPHVAGAVALLKSVVPGMPAAEIKSRLLATVDPVSAFATNTVSHGRMNVARLIEQSAGPYPVVTVTVIEEDGGNGDGINNPGEALALRFTVANRGNQPAQNLIATLSSRAASSQFTITQGTVNLGTLAAGQTLVSSTPFRVQAQSNLTTPYAEEFAITLSHGTPLQTSEYRVSLYLHTSARLEGQVTDAGTQAPLPGATIRVTGSSTLTTTSGTDGRYSLVVTDGVYQITAAMAGYVTATPVQLSTPPGRSGLDFALGVPQFGLTPPLLTETVYGGRTATRTVELRNRGSAPLTWSMELVNGQTVGASAATALPEVEVPAHGDVPDSGPSASFKSQEMRVLPAVNSPMGSLVGVRIGAVNTSWDRGVLVSDLQARGATVVGISIPLTEAQLASIDALIVDDMVASFSTQDVGILRDRVTAGMGLLSEGDNFNSMTRINEIFANTGISAEAKSGFNDLTLTDIRTHPMTLGITSLREVAVGAYANVTGSAQTLVGDSGLAHAAVSRLGSGVVVFIGNEISDSSNYASGDARRFANQIIDGLVSRPEWLAASGNTGVIPPGATATLSFHFDPKDLPAGTYQATALFTTNVPDDPESQLPVTMNLVDAPQISVTPLAVDFGSVVQDVNAQQTVRVRNLGRGPLLVSSTSTTGTDAAFFTITPAGSFSVPAGGFVDLQVGLALDAPLRALSARLVMNSDDPVQPALQILLSGSRQLPPNAASSPAAITVQLKQGQTGSADVVLENKGTGPLSWQASLGYRPGQAGISPTWAGLPGVAGNFLPKVKGQLKVNFDAGSLPPGDVSTTLYIATNDVDTPEISIPVTLKVIAAPRPVFARTVSFPTLIIGQFSRQFVNVQNTGAAPFQLSTPLVLGTSFRWISKMPFIVAPGETRQLELEFRPVKPGAVTTRISFISNVPEKQLYITCTGTGVTGGKLAVTPASMTVSSAPGPLLTRSFKLANSGQLPVSWTAALEGAHASAFTLIGPAGLIPTASSTTVSVTMRTVNTTAGTYRAKLVLTNNTRTPRIEVPLTLIISRAPDLELTPSSLVLGKVLTDAVKDSSLVCKNDGNAPLKILSVVEISPRLSLPGLTTLPATVEPGAAFMIPVRFSSSAPGDFTDEVVITTNVTTQKTVGLQVTSHVVVPPAIALLPANLDVTLRAGERASRDLSISNTGGDTLTWSAVLRDVLGPAAALQTVLSNLESNQTSLTAILPNSHALTEGVSGSSIIDGGANMFDTGNLLSTNLASGATLPYSESGLTSPPGVGAGGSCFTRKQGPLWVFAADLNGASRFTVNGGLGADGAGSATGGTTTRTVAGVTYRGFFKRVTGTSSPSVNHLIIVEDRPGLAHQFDASTDSDFHEVTGLSGTTRLYYLLFGLQNGATYGDSTFGLLMDTFLRRVVHPSTLTWLTPTTGTGVTTPGNTSVHTLQFDTAQLPGGSYTANVRISSNAPARPQVDVPVILRVPAEARLVSTPMALNFPDTTLKTTSFLSCTLANPGNLALTITALTTNDPAYEIAGVSLPVTLQPQQNVTANLRFSPLTTRDHPARLIIASNAAGTPETIVPITGRSLRGAIIGISPASIDLTVDPGVTSTQTVTLTNTGDTALQWNAGPSSNISGIVAMPVTTGTVPPGDSRTISVPFVTTATTTTGTYTGTLRFGSNDPVTPFVDMPVTVVIPARPRLAVLPSAVDFGNVFAGSSASLVVQLRNNGNATLTVNSITSTHTAFDVPALPTPFTLSAGGSLSVNVRFRPASTAVFSGQVRFASSASTPPEVALSVIGTGTSPPVIAVSPGQLSTSLQRGASQALPLTVSNEGGSTLAWQAQVVNPSTSTGTLSDVLQRFNSAHAGLIGRIPDLYLFSEGVSGTNISDGGNDMYDGGNYLNTSLGTAIAYSDNLVTSSTKLGTGGSYFTRKLPGIFLFVADVNDVSSFYTSGNLGADGSGSATASVLTRSYGGVQYTGFLKSVSGTTDPSVNHLIIVETKTGINRGYSTSTDNDAHSVTGLSGSTRVYFLLFARANGLAVNDVIAGSVMDDFLQNVALPPAAPWVTVSPLAGNTMAGGSTAASVNLSTAALPEGTHSATVRFTSNAVVSSTVDVPLSLTVTPPTLAAAPAVINTVMLTDGRPATQTLSLTAQPGSSPAWTAAATVPWIQLSKTSGTGSDSLTLTISSMASSGNFAGAVNIHFDGITLTLPVNVTVRNDTYARLLTDYAHPERVLGLIQSVNGQPALLVALDSTTLVAQAVLALPQMITDMDITTDGRRLYALSYDSHSVTEVDLDAFVISRTQYLPGSSLLSSTAQIEAGRTDRIYYNDAASLPTLHVYDFASAADVSVYLIGGTIGVDGFEASPDGNIIYARSKGAVGSTAFLSRINSAGDFLSQTHASAASLTQASTLSPVFLSANRDAIYTQNASFAPLLGSSTQYPGQNIIAASAYGHALVSGNRILASSTGATLHTLPVPVSVTAFTGAQDALIYHNSSTQQLVRLPLAGMITLPPPGITPQIPDAAVISNAPGKLDWTGSPLAASYDVYLGTDGAAVAAATQGGGGIYRGNTSGVSFTLNSSQFVPGQTYYWRIDIRNHDGSTLKGTVWSFRLPAIIATPESLDVGSAPGADPVSASLGISAANAATAWTLSENAPWLSLSSASGTGTQNITATFDPAALTAGAYSTQITLSSGLDSVQIPVTFRLLGTLNITKMIADPTLQRVYALHRDISGTDSWLLWIDPVTASVQRALLVGANAVDFTVHAADDRLYVLADNGATIIGIDRQTTRQITGTWSTASTAAAIHNGPVGRVVLRTATNALQMYHSVTGGAVGSSVSLPANCVTRTPGSGAFLLVAGQQSTNVIGLIRYTLGSSSITQSATRNMSGSASGSFILSGDGTRAFYQSRSYDATTLTELFFLAPIQASSWNGLVVWSGTQSIASVNGTVFSTLPFSTTIMAATADHSRLVLYSPSTRAFASIDPNTVLITPASVDFGSIPTGQPASRTVNIHNLTSQDLTYSATTNNPAFSGPASSVTVNAGQNAQISLSANLPVEGQQSGTLSLTCNQSQWTRTVAVSATATSSAVTYTIGFEDGAPPANSQVLTASYSEDGFLMTQPLNMLRIGPNLFNRADNGTAHVAMPDSRWNWTITRTGGGSFDLIRVDLAEYSIPVPAPKSVTWTGTTSTGQNVTTTFTTDGIIDGPGASPDFQTFTFPTSFRDLTSARVTVDLYSMDNVVVGLASGGASSAATFQSPVSTAETGSDFDLDADGQPDLMIEPESLSTTQNGITTHVLNGTISSGFSLTRLVVQGSREAGTWSDLTPELDYTVDTATPKSAEGPVSFQIRIPASDAEPWKFRLLTR